MKLKRLEMVNFRQFFGTQEVEFAQGQQNNVTVVHGDNGAGKTTLLNAFTWLFYDEVTMPQPEKIATERALSEASVNGRVTARVSLEFDHEGAQYTAAREQVFRKQSATDLSGRQVDETLSLEYIDEDGNHKRRNNPKSALKQILPQRLREIFFFDGESISELTADDSQDRVQAAIRNIMGLEILERAIRHLEAVEKRFGKTMEKHGSSKLSELNVKKEKLMNEIEALKADRENLRQSRSETALELEETTSRLKELEESKKLQEERDRLKAELEEINTEIAALNGELGDTLNDEGHLPFVMPAVETTAQMLQEKRQTRELPSDIKTTFVDDLLESDECICGRPLGHDTPSREKVQTWQSRAGSSELEEAALNIVGRLSEIGRAQTELFEEIDEGLSDRSSKHDRKRVLKEELDDISETLSGMETEDVARLEKKRKRLESEVADLDKKIGANEAEVERRNSELEEKKAQIAEEEEKNQTANVARRRSQTASYLGSQIESLFIEYQDRVRQSVNDRVNQTFRSIIEKEYYAQIGEEYSLRILKDVGDTEEEDVAKSTGERQVASLSFIASLVSLAKDRYESEEDATYFTGGIYPMLMDSPFGYLDPTYQQRVSQTLPEMGEQVIVLVTESQWSDAVAGEMAAIAGQQYELDYKENQQYDFTEIVATEGGA